MTPEQKQIIVDKIWDALRKRATHNYTYNLYEFVFSEEYAREEIMKILIENT